MFQNLGPALGILRELRGFSQLELARRTDVSKGQISRYESGKDLPKLDTLERLLRVLEYRPDALFALAALLDRLPDALDAESGAPLKSLAIIPSMRSVPGLDQAFESALTSLFVLQRAVFEVIFNGVAIGPRRSRGSSDPDG
jgi:transcriptional regulator with XRE-family HTH domain